MKETVDVAQQQMEADLKTQKEMAKTRKDEEHLELKKQVGTADEVEKAEFKGMGQGFAEGFAGGLERKAKQEKSPAADSAANAQSVAMKKESKAAAHFKGLRTIAREAETSLKARQQWPEPLTGMNVVVTKPIRCIRTQHGFYKLEWPAKWGWGPRADGTTNFIEQ